MSLPVLGWKFIVMLLGIVIRTFRVVDLPCCGYCSIIGLSGLFYPIIQVQFPWKLSFHSMPLILLCTSARGDEVPYV